MSAFVLCGSSLSASPLPASFSYLLMFFPDFFFPIPRYKPMADDEFCLKSECTQLVLRHDVKASML